jgi:hypothetical protein
MNKQTNRKRPQVVADIIKVIDSCKTPRQIIELEKFVDNVCDRMRDDSMYIKKNYTKKLKEITKV